MFVVCAGICCVFELWIVRCLRVLKRAPPPPVCPAAVCEVCVCARTRVPVSPAHQMSVSSWSHLTAALGTALQEVWDTCPAGNGDLVLLSERWLSGWWWRVPRFPARLGLPAGVPRWAGQTGVPPARCPASRRGSQGLGLCVHCQRRPH